MNGKVVRIVIDNREYLFKLSTAQEIERLRILASQLDRRIQKYKNSIATNDYSKILILTCLNLLEELGANQTVEEVQVPTVDKEFIKKLGEIRDLLK